MEEKKTTRAKKKDTDTSWTEYLSESVFRGIQTSFDGAMDRAAQAVDAFLARLAERVFLFFLACLGLIFLLVGVARLVSTAYRFPGVGETLMGVVMLLASFVLYALSRKGRTH